MRKTDPAAGHKPPEGWTKERRYQRTGCDLVARFLYQDRWRKARTTTLSGGGAFLACPVRVLPDQVIWVEIELEGYHVSAISRVVWNSRKKRIIGKTKSYPPGFAVEFENMDGKNRLLVSRFVIKSLRMLRMLTHELEQPAPDRDKIRSLFISYRPGDSINLNHIRKIVKQEFRHYRLRRIEFGDKE